MDAKNKKNQNPIKTIIVMAVIALMIVAYFYVINNRIQTVEEDVHTISPVQELLVKNLDKDYPNTPKEVVKLYSEISRVFYKEEYSEEELEKLAIMSRKLFDDELVANQTDESYLRALKQEIVSYRQEGKYISSYSLSASADVEYYDFKNAKWAQLIAMYSMRQNGKIVPVKERFLLRKDSNDHWKIYGFKLESLEDDDLGDSGE